MSETFREGTNAS
jgi:hypothetical protein